MKVVKLIIFFVAFFGVGLVASFSVFYLGTNNINFKPNIDGFKALTAGFPKFYVVLSGSMEPAMKVGSLAIVIPTPDYGPRYEVGDIISFTKDSDRKNVITHRIVSKEYSKEVIFDVSYLTAGDANKQPDQGKIRPEQIIGKMIFSIPYVGYFIDFVKKPYGFILFVIIPATIIVYEELKNLKRELAFFYRKLRPEKEKEEKGINKQVCFLRNKIAIAVPVIVAAMVLTPFSISYFSDKEVSPANNFQVGIWVTPTPTPTPGPPITDHVVILVINEVYYDVDSEHKGIGAQSRWEWVELFNPTSGQISLTGWSIEDDGASDTFPGTINLPAGGYAIVSPSSESELKDQTNSGGRWSMPAGTIFIDLTDAEIGGGFNSGGDRVIVKDSSGAEIDKMSWGTDVSGFISGCTGNCPNVATGHSLEREPDGNDTDTAGDFVDRETPTPGS